jgi:hypothetical protein
MLTTSVPGRHDSESASLKDPREGFRGIVKEMAWNIEVIPSGAEHPRLNAPDIRDSNQEKTVCAENAMDGLQHARRIGEMFQDVPESHDVERIGGDGNVQKIARGQPDVQPGASGPHSMAGDLNSLGVEAGVHRLTDEQADAGPHVEQPSVRTKLLQDAEFLPLEDPQCVNVGRIGVIDLGVERLKLLRGRLREGLDDPAG